VQGEGAAAKLAEALAAANRRAECDVLLLVRGGGSIEDLWQFNEEALARAIRASEIPVVVGVGHETDFTIADFAADERAPTPTAAAELVSPPLEALRAQVAQAALRLARETARRIEYAMQSVDALARRLVHPAERLRNSRQHLQHLAARLSAAMKHQFAQVRAQLGQIQAVLAGLDHQTVLARGYSLTLNLKDEIVRDATQVGEGEHIVTTLARGSLESQVLKRRR
jgi:exodeoxyribonuclease VII large subunit